MKLSNFNSLALNAIALQTIKAGTDPSSMHLPVSTTTQVNDFNSSRSNRERGN
jgi:hypothetical protein